MEREAKLQRDQRGWHVPETVSRPDRKQGGRGEKWGQRRKLGPGGATELRLHPEAKRSH